MSEQYTADYLRKQAKCVYLAAEESVADDLSAGLKAGAEYADRLARAEELLREVWWDCQHIDAREKVRAFLSGASDD